MESTLRSVSSVSAEESSEEVATYRSPDLEYLAFDSNMLMYRHPSDFLEVDDIVSRHSAGSVVASPMFQIKYDPEEGFDHNTAWHFDPNREINLEHYVACGIRWTDEELAERSHHCFMDTDTNA